MAEKEITLTEILRKLNELDIKVDLLITAAKEGGGLIKPVNYVEMEEWRKKTKLKGLRCKKDCLVGPCRYGSKQALECFEKLEAAMKKRKRRLWFLKHTPYKQSVLHEFRRRDLIMLLSAIGGNMRKLFKTKAGNDILIKEIMKLQPKYVEKRATKEKKKLKTQLTEGGAGPSANTDGGQTQVT